MIKGYLNRPEATADAIRDGWLNTGDIAHIDDDGFVFIVDRAKDMVLRGGENVFCSEVETAIYHHDSVAEAAVFGIPDDRLGEDVAAAIVLAPWPFVDDRSTDRVSRRQLGQVQDSVTGLVPVRADPTQRQWQVLEARVAQTSCSRTTSRRPDVYAGNGDCKLYFETFGDAANPTLLLVNGLGSQCIRYHEDWCRLFAAEGLQVVRFDNRDVGLSSSFENAPTDANGAAYSLSDMAADGFAILDALDVAKAHVLGVSMGGMIVQQMAIERPERVADDDVGDEQHGRRRIPQEQSSRVGDFARAPSSRSRWVRFSSGSTGYASGEPPSSRTSHTGAPMQPKPSTEAACLAAAPRQYAAVMDSGSRAEGLRNLRVPTLVIHGDRDTVIDQIGGRRTAELIPNARFELIEGMGHDYPPQLWGRWVALVAAHIRANS